MKGDVIRTGERPCKVCGKPHDYRATDDDPKGPATWADPDDGHAYHVKSWEEMYREAVAA